MRLCPTSPGMAVFANVARTRGSPVFATFPVGCSRTSCPVCSRRLARRLQKRVRHALAGRTVYLWTFTTDPSILTPKEALDSISRRWHVLHRSLLRLSPAFPFLRVIEWTKSGLPHLHVVTTTWLPWHKVRSLACQQRFGRILNVTPVPAERAARYVGKYALKGLYDPDVCLPVGVRLWSCSNGFLLPYSRLSGPSRFRFVAFIPQYDAWNDATISDYLLIRQRERERSP